MVKDTQNNLLFHYSFFNRKKIGAPFKRKLLDGTLAFEWFSFLQDVYLRICRIMLEKESIMLPGVTHETRVLCSKLCSAGGIVLELSRTKMTLSPRPP